MSDHAVIILAAGGSTRMGQPKQLLKIKGQSLIRKTIETALEAGGDPVVVVLGAVFERIKQEIENLQIIIATNSNWQKGMASSLQIGLSSLQEIAPDTQSVLILLSDQPLVTSDYLKKLKATFQKENKQAVASAYNDVKGVPAIFNFKMVKKFSADHGDFGARHLIKKLEEKNQVGVVSFLEGAVDLDTMEEYERFVKNKRF